MSEVTEVDEGKEDSKSTAWLRFNYITVVPNLRSQDKSDSLQNCSVYI